MEDDDRFYRDEQKSDRTEKFKTLVESRQPDHTIRITYRIELDWVSIPIAIALTAWLLKAILR